jgi:hypothetical protein
MWRDDATFITPGKLQDPGRLYLAGEPRHVYTWAARKQTSVAGRFSTAARLYGEKRIGKI